MNDAVVQETVHAIIKMYKQCICASCAKFATGIKLQCDVIMRLFQFHHFEMGRFNPMH